MLDENFNMLSSLSNEEISQEEAFCQIFKPILEPMDIKDEINPDKVYFVNNKNDLNDRNINYEDFDEFYNKFAGINTDNDTYNSNNNVIYYNEKPSFYTNLCQEIIFSAFENEKYFSVLNIEHNNNIICKNIKKIEDENNISFSKPKKAKKEKSNILNFFPFTPGKGVINNSSLKLSDETNTLGNNFGPLEQETEKISEGNSVNSCDENVYYGFKFKTKKYCKMPDGKIRREKKKRKFKSDDIRKKIKSRFHKALKNIINDLLKNAGSEKFLDFIPQCFIGNISKKLNGQCLDLNYKELLTTNFYSEINKDKPFENHADYKKYLKNKEVLEYLKENPEIRKKSGFDLIMDKKYKDLLKIYFCSSEFEDSLFRLKQENESNDYIQEYISRAKNYVDFYCHSNSEDKNDIESSED